MNHHQDWGDDISDVKSMMDVKKKLYKKTSENLYIRKSWSFKQYTTVGF